MNAISLFVTVFLFQSPNGEHAAGPATTPDAVQQQMQHWLDPVANMRIEWTSYNHDEVKAELPNLTEAELNGYYVNQAFLWDKSGSFRREMSKYEKGTLVYHQVLGASKGDEVAFTVDFKCENGVPKQDKFTIQPLQQSQDNNVILPLRGWIFQHGKYWLAEQSQLPQSLESNESGLVVFDQESTRYFLDPRHSCLPAKIEYRRDKDSAPISVFKVEAFEKTSSSTPYPLTGSESTEQNGTVLTTHWETTKFTLNQVLPPNAFEPPPPDKGVLVVDHISGKNYRADFTQWDRVLELANKAGSNTAEASYENSVLQARPMKWWLLRGAVLLLITVTIIQVIRGVMVRR
ncbi:MAG: hypothetical protein IT423_16830 [Pirellulaceae bacterium]|nr:hypothetical protein [Pirellulaceae bacterium]